MAMAEQGAPRRRGADGSVLGGLARMVPTLTLVGVLWSASSWCYYALAGALGLEAGYDEAPILFAAYYLCWTAVAALLFHGLMAEQITRPRLVGHAVALTPVLLAFAAFVALVLPLLPDVSTLRAPPDPPEFMFASAWYYLPKSADILFQQTLVAIIVRRAARAGLTLAASSVLLAALFGGFHLTLALDGFTGLYVARFTLAATLFGALAPVLYLRTRHGFRWAYGLHWSFYALDAAVTHLVLAVPPWA